MRDIDPLVLLNDTLERCIPITRAMGISADSYDGNRLKLIAPALPNLNDKQTAFAGSSYSIAALCGWSLLFVKLAERGIDADIAVYKGEINYIKPAIGDFYALCAAPEPEIIEDFFAALASRKKARITLSAVVHDAESPVVNFTGRYSVRNLGHP